MKAFDKYVDMKHLKLGTALSIDEVHMEIPGECDYAFRNKIYELPKCNAKATLDRHFRCYEDTYTYEEQFFKINSSFRDIRDLKEKYIAFNNMTGDISEIGSVLDTLINQYASSECYIFKDFSKLLKKYRTAILYSFTIVDTVKCSVRLSNGPIESFNRNPKDMKRTARGYGNFVHARNRLLFSLRDNAPILAIPRKENDFQKKTEIKRGPYKKCEK